MATEMDTFAARLASFDTVLKPEKRRSSTTKGSRLIGWPHQRPSPAEVGRETILTLLDHFVNVNIF